MSEWLAGWIRAGRLETPDALKNQDLWRQLADLSARHKVEWEWVAGHAGHPFNERCDKLAKRAAEEGLCAMMPVIPEIPIIPPSPPPVQPMPLLCTEERAFDEEADGQFRLC
jgi:ribonuclease HI